MKTYKYKNEIIREDELEEIQLPKVGDRFRVTRDRLCSAPMKSGDLITVKEIDGETLIYDTHGWAFNVSEIGDGLEPIPSPPVCPPELLPLPEGAVYCGKECGHTPKWRWSEWKNRWLDDEPWDGWSTSHYATVTGDACHRAQAWFSEDQVPEPPTQYPPPESEWPEKPEPPDGCEWVRQEKVGRTEKGQQYLFLHRAGSGVWWCGEHRDSWSGTVVFRAVPIDYTEGGKYRMLEVGKDVLQEGDEISANGESVTPPFWGDKVMIDDMFRRPVKSDLQEKLAQLKILVDEIGKLNKSEA